MTGTDGVTAPPRERPAPTRPVPRTQIRWAGYGPDSVFGSVELAGGLAELTDKVITRAVRKPVDYWSAARDETYNALRVSWFPMTLAVFTFGLMIDILGLISSGSDEVRKKGTSAVSVGPVRGRCAACGAAPPRPRAPAASLREAMPRS
jgi:hypothetical protein